VSIVTQAGADDIVVNDLTGTDITQVTINLAATPSGNTGDHSIDHVTINATGGADTVELRAQAGGIVALGLNTPITITRIDATDQILVNGGGGADLLFASDAPANSGKFFFDGGSGNDTIFGGLGDDSIVGGTGADRLDGGSGLDTLDYRLSGAGVTVDLGLGTGLGGDAAGDIVSGFERLLGSGFNDILTGSAALDQILGGNGVDSLLGQAGNDILQGEAGNDRLTGGAGADQLTGGLGADRFVLLDASDSVGTTRDKITDFHHAEGDRIELSAIDANPAAGGNNGFTFIGTAAFDGGKGELNVVYGTGVAIVSGDIDGNKVADFSIIVAGVDATNPFVSTDFAL
jgi:Ca2+-binding RTX toxin-like protein